MPTPDEDAAIHRGIADDPDNPELPADFGARAVPLDQVFPPEMLATVRRRGPGKRPAKVMVAFRLPPDLAEKLRSIGPGWQVKAGEALAKLVDREPARRTAAPAPRATIRAPAASKRRQPGMDSRRRDPDGKMPG